MRQPTIRDARLLLFALGMALIFIIIFANPSHLVEKSAVGIPYNASLAVGEIILNDSGITLASNYYQYMYPTRVDEGKVLTLTWSSDLALKGIIMTESEYDYWSSHTTSTSYTCSGYGATGALSAYIATPESMVVLVWNQGAGEANIGGFTASVSPYDGPPIEPVYTQVSDAMTYSTIAFAVIFIGGIIVSIPFIRSLASRASKPGSGGMLGVMKATASGSTFADEMSGNFARIGVEVEEVDPKGHEDFHKGLNLGGYGNAPLKLLRLRGRNIDFVEIYRVMTRGRGASAFVFLQNYVVKADPSRLPQEMKAALIPVFKGAFSSEVVDFRWVDRAPRGLIAWRLNLFGFIFGLVFMGIPLFMLIDLLLFSEGAVVNYSVLPFAVVMMLAFIAVGFWLSLGQLILLRRQTPVARTMLGRTLEIDPALKQAIMRAFRETGVAISIRPGANHVSIAVSEIRASSLYSQGLGSTSALDPSSIADMRDLPSREAFEVYDAIAGHIRRIIPGAR